MVFLICLSQVLLSHVHIPATLVPTFGLRCTNFNVARREALCPGPVVRSQVVDYYATM